MSLPPTIHPDPVLTEASPEAEVKERLAAGDRASVWELVVQAYGAEIYGFVVAVLDDGFEAEDIYAGVCNRVAADLPSFAWTCALRTWAYGIARKELAARGRAAPGRVGGSRTLHELPDPTSTVSFRPIESRARMTVLRRRLPREDRVLLVLRIARSFDWPDIAKIAIGWDANALDLAREARRLRARMAELRSVLARAAEELVTR
ncbi:MAG TPA: hypothetical protein VGG39_00140 [Polyangiaceae bacterium]|jgi:RNA polymerase sigma-70 factor (ECF subfamily)